MRKVVEVAKVFTAGCVVYFVMAACGSDGGGGASSSGGHVPGSSDSPAPTPPTPSSSGPSSPVPNAMGAEWYTAGSRLKVRYLEASDGAKQFVGWFDSARSEECTFRSYEVDGTLRCLPTAIAPYQPGFFADADCKTPLALAQPSGPVKYALLGDSKRIYAATPFAGTPYSNVTGSCKTVDGSNLLAIGAEVPGSAFVQATAKTSP